MLYPPNKEKEVFTFRKFIDFDKLDRELYNNFYLKDANVVVKMPLMGSDNTKEDSKIEKFSLEKSVYLVSYE